MSREHIVSGLPFPVYVNETGARDEILAGVYLSETVVVSVRRQVHFRFRTDAGAADANPTWGATEDDNTFNPGGAAFRTRLSISNLLGNAGTLNHALYVSKNGGAYAPVTTTSTMGVKSTDAGSDADDTKILVPRLTMPT